MTLTKIMKSFIKFYNKLFCNAPCTSWKNVLKMTHNLAGPTRENPELDLLAVQHPDNRLYINIDSSYRLTKIKLKW